MTQADPKIAVIILNWNGKEDTLECLESVYKIDYLNYEVILVDNGSTDGSVEIIKQRFPDTIVIENKKNIGFAEGNNKGIRYALNSHSEYVLLLNNDAVIDSRAVSELIGLAESDKNIGAIGPLILYYKEKNKVWSAGGLMNFYKGDWIKIKGERAKEKQYDVDALSGCCLMARASVLRECGLFDGNFYLYGEDIDLCLRIKEKGYRLVCALSAQVQHKVGRTTKGSESPFYIYYITRNRLLLMKKHASGLNWLFFLPYFIYSVMIKQILSFAFKKKYNNILAIYSGINDFIFNKFGPGKAAVIKLLQACPVTPKVAVIILNWNGKQDTLECLESVRKIDYSNFEVIIADNGSSDDSIEAIKGMFKDMIIIENKKNLGFSGGNNAGLKYALARGADFLLILNNDTIVEPLIINELKKAMDADIAIGAISPLVAYYERPAALHFEGTKVDWSNGDLCRQYAKEYAASANTLLSIDFTAWCASFIRREAIEKVGFLDEKFFAYYEDVDWGFRCKKAGFKNVLYPKVLVYHKVSRSTGGKYSPPVYFYLFRNRLIFMRKHAGFLRKLQFSICYIRDSCRQYDILLKQDNPDAAKAVMDAFWSALNGCAGDQRLSMPPKLIISRNILNLTYFWVLTIRALLTDEKICV